MQSQSAAGRDPADTEIVVEREFAASRSRLWTAWTDAAQVAQWWGPQDFTTRVDELDLRPGGKWRYLMRGPDGTEFPIHGMFREVVAYERIVTSDEFGADGKPIDKLPQGMVVTTEFADTAAGSRVTLRIAHPSVETRQQHEALGVVAGWESTFDCLAEFLAQQPAEDEVVVRVSHRFAAPAEYVFDSWIDPARLTEWLLAPTVCEEGEEVLHVALDARVGGAFSFLVRRNGIEIDHVGTYHAIDRPRRLAFTWGVAGESVDESVVTIEVVARDDGCALRLTHVMHARWAELAERVAEGWTRALAHLAD